MPELPEVETVRRHLEVLTGLHIERVRVLHRRVERRQHDGRVAARLTGRTVISGGRHGKFLLFDLDDDATWILHLGMSGSMQLRDPGVPAERHTVLTVDFGTVELRFVDPRTFGFTVVVDDRDDVIGHLGPDAVDVTVEQIGAAFGGRTAPVKALLLDQRVVAGLGNIYSDEVLFRAGVLPTRPAGSLTGEEVERIHGAIGPVLAEALAVGGTTLDDLAFLLPDGAAAGDLERLSVYGRTGLPCRRCGRPVRRTVLRGRGTHYCDRCQR